MFRLLRGRYWVAASCIAAFDYTRVQLRGSNQPMSADSSATPDAAMETRSRPASVPVEPVQYRLLVVGKTGNGKSSLCNSILGENKFQTGRSMTSTTLLAQHSHAARNGVQLKVVDTPDVINMEGASMSLDNEVQQWKALTSPSPSAILLVVRCDVRYTPEEYDIYRRMKQTWGDKSFTRRLMVAFTFGDRQDQDIDEELKSVCPELKSVLRDARHRYVVFDNTVSDNVKEAKVTELLGKVHEMETQEEHEPDDVLKKAQIGLLIGAVVTGICLAAVVTADKRDPTAVFGVLCAAFTAGLAASEVYKKLRK